jgi:PPK2 family polyphosphate:nucleotide phosphotransferase
MIKKKYIRKLMIREEKSVDLADYETDWAATKVLRTVEEEEVKDDAARVLEENRQSLATAQELLWASGAYAVLIVLQGLDAAGKDGTIRHVMSGVNPQGCRVESFKVPTLEELNHDFLWRYEKALPSRGEIGIFNRSYYEDVLVVRVHPELLQAQNLQPGKKDDRFWMDRYKDINAFEKHLVLNGTVILKFFLHISKEEQKKRLLARLDDSEKSWKFSLSDLTERGYWKDYVKAYEAMLSATGTKHAPWFVIPADHKWAARALIAEIIATTIQGLDLEYPKPNDQQKGQMQQARRELESED